MGDNFRLLSDSYVPLESVLAAVTQKCQHLFVPSKFDETMTWCVHCKEKRSLNVLRGQNIKETEEELITKMTNYDIF